MDRFTAEWLRPRITETDEPFWAAARNHTLRMQACEECGYVRWPPGPVCPECWCDRAAWTALTGSGIVNTWVVYHRAYYEGVTSLGEWEAETPYTVAEIELDEGPRYVARLVDCERTEIERGLPVEVAFRELGEELTLPVFEPRSL